jgi:hypothetical protein
MQPTPEPTPPAEQPPALPPGQMQLVWQMAWGHGPTGRPQCFLTLQLGGSAQFTLGPLDPAALKQLGSDAVECATEASSGLVRASQLPPTSPLLQSMNGQRPRLPG